jgi:hypothetical protein
MSGQCVSPQRRIVRETIGGTFVTPPRSQPYGRIAVFLDIAGNGRDLLGPPDEALRQSRAAADRGAVRDRAAEGMLGPDAPPERQSMINPTITCRR